MSESNNLTRALVDQKDRLQAALPAHINVGDFVRLALTEVQRNPRLAECDTESVFLACMEAARLGAIPGTMGHGWLIPRKIKGRSICNFHPGYRLFVDLARRSNKVTKIEAHVVYKNDVFDLEFGTEPKLVHKPVYAGDPGPPVGAYAVAFLTSGAQVEYMRLDDIEKCRAAGMADSPAWKNWWDQMAKKVVLKRASKMWPLAVEDQRSLDALVAYDNDVEVETRFATSHIDPPRSIASRVRGFKEIPELDLGVAPEEGTPND